MKKSLLASLLVPILLAGCSDSPSSSSSSSNGGSSSGTYTWQIVHLESVDESALNSRCVIYADSTIETDDSIADTTNADPEYQVVTAYVADEDYNILYHNEDGSIAKTIESGDINDGLLSISLTDVPENGYVTLEELSGDIRSDYIGSYMFSVQKSLLSSMVLNIPQEQTGTSCVTGSDHREGETITKFVSVEQEDNNVYYQTSYDVNSIAGSEISTDIAVAYIEGDSRDVLVTVFDDYVITDMTATTETTIATPAEERTNLLNWVFVDSSLIYDAVFDEDGNFKLDDDGDEQYEVHGADSDLNNAFDSVLWSDFDSDSTTDAITLNNTDIDDDGDIDENDVTSGVIVIHDDNTYLWQPIYDTSTELTVDYDADEVDVWNTYLSGVVTLTDKAANTIDWGFTSFNFMGDNPSSIILADFGTAVTDSLDNSVVLTNTCSGVVSVQDSSITTTPSFCIDLSDTFVQDEFSHQRLHIRLQENDGDLFETAYQTIFAKANTEPVVLISSNVNFTTPTLERIELNLMSTDDEDLNAVQYLMSQNIDLVSVAEYASIGGDDSAESDTYNDLNGYVATKTEIETLYQAVLKTNTTIVQSAYKVP